MKYVKLSWLAVACVGLGGCAFYERQAQPQVQTVEPYRQRVIALENLYTREIAYCKASADFTAEKCAADLEKKGFVKLTDVPRFTAADDLLEDGQYPSRRWRDDDKAPRW